MTTVPARAALKGALASTLLVLMGLVGPALGEARPSKDAGPSNGACDRHAKGSAAWLGCVGAAGTSMPDQELFYAGYWLAKIGQYESALRYLAAAKVKDERVLTYIGFATRKLGDVDGALPYYARALEINPKYSVARAYLGEAYLTRGEVAKAEAELAEIGRWCGVSCAEYADLAGRIREHAAGKL